MPDAGDVGGHLDLGGQADAGHLAKRRVGLLGRGRVHTDADPAPLGTAPERSGLRLVCRLGAALADQLLKGGHDPSVYEMCAKPRNSAREYEERSWSEATAYQRLSSHVKPRTGRIETIARGRSATSGPRLLRFPPSSRRQRRRPFAEDRRRGTLRSISCAGGQGCRIVPQRDRADLPAPGGGTARQRRQPMATSIEKAHATRASAP